MAVIYKIQSPNGKIYIGSTVNFKKRMKQYSTLDCKNQIKIYNSLKKYGFNNHKIVIITECTTDKIFQLESYYGQLYNVLGVNGLNLRLPKLGDTFISVSDETRKKISIAQSGKNGFWFGKKGISIPCSEEKKIFLSKLRKGVILTKEQKEKQRLAIIAVRSTKESKAKTSIASTGGKNGMAKKVICSNSGIIFGSKSEAAIFLGINSGTLGNYLRGRHTNKTTLKYYI